MTDYTAQIKSKGLDSTGVTEDIARQLYNKLGSHGMAIVEYTVDSRSETTEGTHKVQLSLTQVEPAVDEEFADHLRELVRTAYLNRQHADGQLAIDSSLGEERTVADVLASGKSLRPHPFLPDDATKDQPICDVCGSIEASAVHSTQEILDGPDDELDDDEPDDVDDPAVTEGLIEADENPDDDGSDPTYDEVDSEGNPIDPTDGWDYPAPEPVGSGVSDPFTTT